VAVQAGLIARADSDAHIDRIQERFERDGFGLWALEVIGTGQFIGFTGLAPMPDGVPGAGGTEVGWRLARDAWHHGYATEAARACVDVAFGGLGLPEIWSITAVLNEPSQAVMRRLAMSVHGYFDHPRVPDGHRVQPHVAYHLTRPAQGGPVS
jgi:RimJ/RimL family protein N-acetyltransferase